MDEEEMGRLFTAFQQADGSISRRFGGTGLGLAICKKIITLMGGGIWVESKKGKGSRFIFEVNIGFGNQLEETAGTAAAAPSSSPHAAPFEAIPAEKKIQYPSWKGKTILLAEDIDINREILASILEPTEVEIVHAENGEEAIRLFSAKDTHYDLILMDMQMPVMDGISATRHIRDMERKAYTFARIPIIAMTANAFAEDVKRCLDAGMDDHIAKPIDVDELLRKLEKHLDT
ncbi:response regulator [Treponema sp. OttesenSCG-928-L16]|nr:response regulator [Treponema sp. OttesenSCG-928-L16]